MGIKQMVSISFVMLLLSTPVPLPIRAFLDSIRILSSPTCFGMRLHISPPSPPRKLALTDDLQDNIRLPRLMTRGRRCACVFGFSLVSEPRFAVDHMGRSYSVFTPDGLVVTHFTDIILVIPDSGCSRNAAACIVLSFVYTAISS
jgi:hypothetical protein